MPTSPRRRPAGLCACSARSRLALAMLSAFATFVVLADLTPIAPTHEVVVTLLLINAVTVFLLLGIIAREVWLVVQARRRGRAGGAAACADRRPVRHHRRGAGDPGRGGRQHHARPRPRPAVLDAHPRHHREFADRRRRLSARARADHPRRHRWRCRSTWRAPSRCSITTASASSSSSPRRRAVRGLSAAMIIGADAAIIERADIKSDQPSAAAGIAGLANVNENEPQIALLLSTNAVAAVVKLRSYDNAYLSITRPLDPRVVAQSARDPGHRQRFRQPAIAPLRRAACLRADVYGDRAGGAAVGGVARA